MSTARLLRRALATATAMPDAGEPGPLQLDDKAVSILTNREVIAVDQAGVIPAQVTGGTLQVWKKRLPDGRLAVAVYNLGDQATDITVAWEQLGVKGNRKVRDLVNRHDLGKFSKSWTAKGVPAHGSRLITLSRPGHQAVKYPAPG